MFEFFDLFLHDAEVFGGTIMALVAIVFLLSVAWALYNGR